MSGAPAGPACLEPIPAAGCLTTMSPHASRLGPSTRFSKGLVNLVLGVISPPGHLGPVVPPVGPQESLSYVVDTPSDDGLLVSNESVACCQGTAMCHHRREPGGARNIGEASLRFDAKASNLKAEERDGITMSSCQSRKRAFG